MKNRGKKQATNTGAAAVAAFLSEEGGQQALVPLGFCAAARGAVKRLDAALGSWRGAARFLQDGSYACGPPWVIFDALRPFEAELAQLGLKAAARKCECWCPTKGLQHLRLASGMPMSMSTTQQHYCQCGCGAFKRARAEVGAGGRRCGPRAPRCA